MIQVGDLYKQGKCEDCSIPLYGYSEINRKKCGECQLKETNYTVTFIPKKPKCVVCGSTLKILHNSQRYLKKYCSYKCQKKKVSM